MQDTMQSTNFKEIPMTASQKKATRLLSLKPSPTLMLNQQASDLKAQGIDILSLTAGEPDFPTPTWICDAAKKAIDDGETRYTAVGGTKDLRQAIIKKFARDNHLDYTLDQVMAGTGGKQILFNAFLATINPGDEVIIQAPYWVSYPPMVEIAEGSPIIVETFAQTNFKITPDQLEQAITARTKWFILNSPSNPTGAVYTYDELFALAQVLRRHPQVMVLCDDIYEHIIYDTPFNTLVSVDPELKERTLIVNGVSKAYSMTGWRIGYGAGPAWLIKTMTSLQSQSTSNPCSISQAAAVAALNGPQDFQKDWRDAFHSRLEIILTATREMPGVSLLKPQGAFYAFLEVHELLGKKTPQGDRIANDQDLAAYFLTEARVATVPGSAFGAGGHVRLSYATSKKVLQEAMSRLQDAISKLQD